MSDEGSSLMHMLHDLERSCHSYICVLGKVGKKLRSHFPSLLQLEGYRCSYINLDGFEEEGFFSEKLKHMILKSYPEEDIEIARQYKNLNAYSRDRTSDQLSTIKSYRKISDKVQKRYNRILMVAYGEKCVRCLCQDKKSLANT